MQRAGRVHVALLRGIDVAGNNRLTMKDLSDVFAGVGCTNIETTSRAAMLSSPPRTA